MSQTQRIFADRIFAGVAIDGTSNRPWYCLAREGILGPYASERQASAALRDFIAECLESGATGDRQPVPVQRHWRSGASCAV